MKTRKHSILLVVMAASIVVAMFMDVDDLAAGYRDGMRSDLSAPVGRPSPVPA